MITLIALILFIVLSALALWVCSEIMWRNSHFNDQ